MLPLLKSARALVERGMAVTLLTDHPLLYYSGMVPEYTGGVYAQHQVTIDLVGWCARTGVRFFPGRAAALDVQTRTVTTADNAVLGFDVAAFDVGSVNPGRNQARNALHTHPLHHIESLEKRVAQALAGDAAPLHVAIVGGGAAGVEIAFNLTARAHAHRPDALRLSLFEPEDRLLPDLPAGLGAHARQVLEARGAAVHLCTKAQAAERETVVLADGTRVACDVVLWATGSKGHPLFRRAGLAVTDKDFVRVGRTLQVENHPYLLAAGDCAAVAGLEGLRRIGVHAVKQGSVLRYNAIHTATALQAGREPTSLRRFRPYPVAPLILSTGAPEGLWTAGKLWFKGTTYLRLKHAVDRRWMRKYQFIDHYDALFDTRAPLEEMAS